MFSLSITQLYFLVGFAFGAATVLAILLLLWAVRL